jgi:hypothetical protein
VEIRLPVDQKLLKINLYTESLKLLFKINLYTESLKLLLKINLYTESLKLSINKNSYIIKIKFIQNHIIINSIIFTIFIAFQIFLTY